jgi:hypothetical protein
MPRRFAALLLALSSLLAAAGCGGTLRAGLGPTIDTDGHPGILARVEAGVAAGFTDRYSGAETVAWTGGVGSGYGNGDTPAAMGILAGLELMRAGEDDYDLRAGPTFRVEVPTAGDDDDDVTVAVGVRVALLRILTAHSTSKTWNIGGGEKGGASFHFGWDHVRHLAFEASAEYFWHDDRGERLRFGLLIGYEKSVISRP